MLEFNFLERIAADQQVLTLLIMLPVVATIVGFSRYIIGVRSLGVYAPVVLTYAFYALGLSEPNGSYSDIWVGLRLGTIFTVITVIVALLGSAALKYARLHYFPKVSAILSLVAITLTIAMIFVEYFEISGFSSVGTLALVLIASVSEQFASIAFKKKRKTALLLTFETYITSVFCYALIAWPTFQRIILTYPYLIVLTFVLNYIIGKYKGLRLREYIRFADVLNKDQDK